MITNFQHTTIIQAYKFGGRLKNFKVFATLFLTFFVGLIKAEEAYLPSNILMMDSKFSHHILIVEKSTHKLHLYENNGSLPKLVKTFSIATGKFKGDKTTNGDHKTPEGIYLINEFLSKEELFRRHGKYAEIYGSGAFPMNYPNLIDTREGKSGSGIWLHSTDDDNRIYKGLDSRGCVVVQNADLKELSKYIELENTPIVVVQDIFYLSKTTWERNRKEISQMISNWSEAWQNKDFNNYISSYDPVQFHDKSKGNFNSYKQYKSAVFSRPDKPSIKFDQISIMSTQDYAVVHLQQDYRSNVINDIGKKTLYLKKNSNYDWKIVGELWTKSGVDNIAFSPSLRFFKE